MMIFLPYNMWAENNNCIWLVVGVKTVAGGIDQLMQQWDVDDANSANFRSDSSNAYSSKFFNSGANATPGTAGDEASGGKT